MLFRSQGDAAERLDEFYEDAWAQLFAAFKPALQVKMEAKVKAKPELKAVYVDKAMEKGWLKWQIGGAA